MARKPKLDKDSIFQASTRKAKAPEKPKAEKKPPAGKKEPKPKKRPFKDYSYLKPLSLALYLKHAARLDELVAYAREKALAEGGKPPSKSDLVRLAIEVLGRKDIDKMF